MGGMRRGGRARGRLHARIAGPRASFITMRYRTGTVAFAAFAAFGCGCGADGGTPDAGGATDGAGVEPRVVPDPPSPVALPILTPCPPGWREVMDPSGVIECDAWPESGHASCARRSALPG